MNGEEHPWMLTVTEETLTTGAEVVGEGYGVPGEGKENIRAAGARGQLHEQTTEPAHPGYEVSRAAREEATWLMLA